MAWKMISDGAKKDIVKLHALLWDDNHAHREASEDVPPGIFPEDEAGLMGESFVNRLCIKYLFVTEALRGQGIGRKLMEMAEEEARKHHCQYVFVDTFDFQSPDFYRKPGYRYVFRLAEYPYTGFRAYDTKE